MGTEEGTFRCEHVAPTPVSIQLSQRGAWLILGSGGKPELSTTQTGAYITAVDHGSTTVVLQQPGTSMSTIRLSGKAVLSSLAVTWPAAAASSNNAILMKGSPFPVTVTEAAHGNTVVGYLVEPDVLLSSDTKGSELTTVKWTGGAIPQSAQFTVHVV